MATPEYRIDGRACTSFASTVREFNRVFAPWWGDGYWGGSLDLFNDILDWVEDFRPYVLVWSHSAEARRALGHVATAGWLREDLGEERSPYGQERRRRLRHAEQGKGPTLFDDLIEVIRDHPNITLRLE